jgi:hypothetical protein
MRRKSFAFIALIPMLVMGFPSVSSALSLPYCTIYGTDKVDRITGTAGNDIICAGAGNDIVNGLGGDDVIYGGLGNDRINAGSGADDVYGDPGSDYIDGGSGKDDISGGAGSDTISGGTEADIIDGDSGTDTIAGGTGDDAINGGDSKDQIRSGVGDDSCSKDPADVHFDSCKLDTNAPEIGVNTTVVRNFQAGTTIKLNWTVSDSSGVEKTWGSIGGAPGWVTWCGFGIQGNLVSGNEKSGTYQIECKLPEKAVNETYSLFVGAVDVLGNSIANMPQIAFTVTGGSEDKSAPAVYKIALDSSSKPGAEFTMVAGVNDETGVKGVYGWFMKDGGGFASWTDGSSYVRALDSAQLVNGDSKSGVYKQVHRFSSAAPSGTYTLWLSLLDELGNKSFEQTDKKIVITD